MVSLGEMIAYLPLPGGHIKLAERFVNPAMYVPDPLLVVRCLLQNQVFHHGLELL
jgi:hypothetical protein